MIRVIDTSRFPMAGSCMLPELKSPAQAILQNDE